MLVIAFYFRFPYLDRRSNWFSNVRRFDIRTPAAVDGIKAITESISFTGCRFSFDTPREFKKSEIIKIKFLEISKIEIDAEVIEKSELGIRVEFRNPSVEFKQDIDRWLRTRA